MKDKKWPKQIWDEECLDWDLPRTGKEYVDDWLAGAQEKPYLSMDGLAFNQQTSARSMAKMAAFMANKGTFEGKQMISEETW